MERPCWRINRVNAKNANEHVDEHAGNNHVIVWEIRNSQKKLPKANRK